MKTLAFVVSAALCLSALPVLAAGPDGSITLAQADVRIGVDGVSVGDRDRDHDRDHDRRHNRDRFRLGEGRDHDRHCRTVTVEEHGQTRTSRRCD
jgi:hypothetical protein